jgi:hypothetical protein
VALVVGLEVIWLNILDRAFIDISRRYVACGNQVAQPLRGVWADLVVIGRHFDS